MKVNESTFVDCPLLMEKIKNKEINKRNHLEQIQFYENNCKPFKKIKKDQKLGPQKYKKEADIFSVNNLTFYGYDYSLFKFFDHKNRITSVDQHISTWIDFNLKHLQGKDKLGKWLKKEVSFQTTPTDEINMSLNPKNILTDSTHTISEEQLQPLIHKYHLKEKTGVGFVIVVECFDTKTKRNSAYFTFFDISSRKIIGTQYMSFQFVENYRKNSLKWGVAQLYAFKAFVPIYQKAKKKYR